MEIKVGEYYRIIGGHFIANDIIKIESISNYSIRYTYQNINWSTSAPIEWFNNGNLVLYKVYSTKLWKILNE